MGLLSASGSQSSSATEQANAFQMAVDEINGQGGVAGHRIDTTTDGSASRLVQNSDVDVIIAQSAPVDSAAIQATSGTVLMHAGSYDPPACPKNVISTGPVPNQQVEPMARWLTKNVGHSVFVVGLANGWCRASLQVLRGMAPPKGGQSLVAAWHLVPAGTTDFSGLLKQVAQVNPAVLWSLMSGDDAIALAKQLAKVDVKALIVSTGWNDVTAAAVPGLLVGALISQPWLMSLSTPESTKFVSSYQRRFGKQPISALGEATYDAVYLYKTAVERAGTTTADQVIKALPQVQFNAPQGLVRIDSATRVIVTNSLIGQVTAQGTIEVHERLGTIDPVLSGCRPG
jgi:ABC-type branched-subunit amino acid transport system substrate-binding protein